MNKPILGSYEHVKTAGRSPDKVVVYLRAGSGQNVARSIELQHKACLDWIERENKVLVAEEVELVSGKDDPGERSGIHRAIEALESHRAGVLLIFKMDRLGRSSTQALQLLLQARDNLGVVVVAVHPPDPSPLQSQTGSNEIE